MKARTIGIVAAAGLGLAGLVGGCKESAPRDEYDFYDSNVIIDEETGARIEMDFQQLLITKGNMSFYIDKPLEIAEVKYKNSNNEIVELHVSYPSYGIMLHSVEIGGNSRPLYDKNSELFLNALRNYTNVCAQLKCKAGIEMWEQYRDNKIEEYRQRQARELPLKRLD